MLRVKTHVIVLAVFHAKGKPLLLGARLVSLKGENLLGFVEVQHLSGTYAEPLLPPNIS